MDTYEAAKRTQKIILRPSDEKSKKVGFPKKSNFNKRYMCVTLLLRGFLRNLAKGRLYSVSAYIVHITIGGSYFELYSI